jgi:hypothetical protein
MLIDAKRTSALAELAMPTNRRAILDALLSPQQLSISRQIADRIRLYEMINLPPMSREIARGIDLVARRR